MILLNLVKNGKHLAKRGRKKIVRLAEVKRTHCARFAQRKGLVPGEDMCYDDHNSRKFKRKNEWDEYDEELQHQPAQLLGICQVCDYCRHFTFDTVDSHEDDGTRQITVGNATYLAMEKKLEWYQGGPSGWAFFVAVTIFFLTHVLTNNSSRY